MFLLVWSSFPEKDFFFFCIYECVWRIGKSRSKWAVHEALGQWVSASKSAGKAPQWMKGSWLGTTHPRGLRSKREVRLSHFSRPRFGTRRLNLEVNDEEKEPSACVLGVGGGSQRLGTSKGSSLNLSDELPSRPQNRPEEDRRWTEGLDGVGTIHFLLSMWKGHISHSPLQWCGPVESSGRWKKRKSDVCHIQIWPLRFCVTLYSSLSHPIYCHMRKIEGTRTALRTQKRWGSHKMEGIWVPEWRHGA